MRAYFDASVETSSSPGAQVGDPQVPTNLAEDDVGGVGAQEDGTVKYNFARHDAVEDIGTKRREERERDAERFADRMGAIAAQVRASADHYFQIVLLCVMPDLRS